MRVLLVAALTLLAGCADMLLSESATAEARGLLLSATTSADAIAPGDTLRLVARLTNTNPHAVRLSFNSGCQIMPLIEDDQGEPVEPGSGGWICTAAITHLALASGETVEREFVWTGTTRSYDPASGRIVDEPLPPGTYGARAHLQRALIDGPHGALVELRTRRIPVVLR